VARAVVNGPKMAACLDLQWESNGTICALVITHYFSSSLFSAGAPLAFNFMCHQ